MILGRQKKIAKYLLGRFNIFSVNATKKKISSDVQKNGNKKHSILRRKKYELETRSTNGKSFQIQLILETQNVPMIEFYARHLVS